MKKTANDACTTLPILSLDRISDGAFLAFMLDMGEPDTLRSCACPAVLLGQQVLHVLMTADHSSIRLQLASFGDAGVALATRWICQSYAYRRAGPRESLWRSRTEAPHDHVLRLLTTPFIEPWLLVLDDGTTLPGLADLIIAGHEAPTIARCLALCVPDTSARMDWLFGGPHPEDGRYWVKREYGCTEVTVRDRDGPEGHDIVHWTKHEGVAQPMAMLLNAFPALDPATCLGADRDAVAALTADWRRAHLQSHDPWTACAADRGSRR